MTLKKDTYNYLAFIVLVMYGCLKKPYIISNASFKSILGLQVYKLILHALFSGYVRIVKMLSLNKYNIVAPILYMEKGCVHSVYCNVATLPYFLAYYFAYSAYCFTYSA